MFKLMMLFNFQKTGHGVTVDDVIVTFLINSKLFCL